MSDRVDRILEVIDVGLQQAGGIAYGTDSGECIRCQWREPARGSSWCEACAVDKESPPVEIAHVIRRATQLLVTLAAAWRVSYEQTVDESDPLT